MDSKRTQSYLKEHNIPSLDVDWVISARKISKKKLNDSLQNKDKVVVENNKAFSQDDTSFIPKSSKDTTLYADKKRRNSIATSIASDNSSSNTNHNFAHETTQLDSSSHLFKEQYRGSDFTQNDRHSTTVPLRRSKSLSMAESNNFKNRNNSNNNLSKAPSPSPPPTQEKKTGFFKGLFGRRKSISTPKSTTTSLSNSSGSNNSSNSNITTNNNKNDGKNLSDKSQLKIKTTKTFKLTETKDGSISPNKPTSRKSNNEIVMDGVPLRRTKTDSAMLNENRNQHPHIHMHHHHHHERHHEEDDQKSNDINLINTNNDRNNDNDIHSIDLTDIDPRLVEFLKYYKSKNYSLSAFKDKNFDNNSVSSNNPQNRFKKAAFVINDDSEDYHQPFKQTKFDAKGRPLPAHPERSKLPSAFKKQNNNDCTRTTCNNNTNNNHGKNNNSLRNDLNVVDSSVTTIASAPQATSSKKFGAFLKRVTSYGTSNENTNDELDDVSPTTNNKYTNTHETITEFDPANTHVVPGLETIKPLKHVAFKTNTFFNDPPQQICSKNPRKGEVEVKSNGSVVIHRLTPQERREILQQYSSGIVVGGSGQLRLLSNEEGMANETDLKKHEEQAPVNPIIETPPDEKKDEEDDFSPDACEETNSQLRKIEVVAAEAAAEARAKETPNELSRTVTNNEEDVSVSKTASHLTIDKPMISRRSSNNLISGANSISSIISSVSKNEDEDDTSIFPPPSMKIAHDVVYTRCCHLREILPIPATLKQLKKGSTDPIPLLQLRNPRPSMVEILAFTDFIAIAPILCISLDGVHLTTEMLKLILSSLVYRPKLEKLSLRNTPLDEEGWKLLSFFVSKSKSLNALDLTMVPQIKTNVQKPSKSSLKSNIVRMESNLNNRSDMNWYLLAGSIAFRNGIDELVLAGANMSVSEFKTFIEIACVNTYRLSLAYNNLTLEQCQILADWIVHSKVTGLDIGYNDLRGKIQPFYDALWNKINNKGERNVFKYISFNGTNLEVKKGDTSANNDALKLLSILCYSEDVKFIDLSNNPNMFPYSIPTLLKILPVFVNLVRLHIDNNNLSRTSIITLAEVLPLCRQLRHLSMTGTELDLASCKAFAEAVKKSKSLITVDIDYVYMPDKIKEKISLYAMRNIQNELDRSKANLTPNFIDGNKPTEQQFKSIQEELAILLTEDKNNVSEEEYIKIVDSFIERLSIARKKINKVVQDLFALRLEGELNLEGKETLIRLSLLDASLEKGIRLLKERHDSDVSNSSVSNIASNRTSEDNVSKNGFSPIKKTESDLTMLEPKEVLLSASNIGKSGHSALLPFGSAKIEKTHHRSADDTVEYSDEHPQHLIDPLHENDKDIDETRSPRHHITEEEKNILANAAENMNSDEIKELLLKNDVSTVIGVIDELHKQGYHLHHIFKKNGTCDKNNSNDSSSKEDNDKTDLSSKIKNDKAETKLGDAIPTDAKKYDEFITNQETEAIDEAYDQVLDSIQYMAPAVSDNKTAGQNTNKNSTTDSNSN